MMAKSYAKNNHVKITATIDADEIDINIRDE
jgi:hypothetical protein